MVHSGVERFHIVTGGPGSGKSSLIEALYQRGFARSIEAGRAIIQEQSLIGGRAVPWEDRALFAELMLVWEMRSYRTAEKTTGVWFFDRGVPDVLAYLRLCGLPIPGNIRKAAEFCRYNRRVFITPPWQEIFRQDQERKQDFDEAIRTYQSLRETYSELGYDLIEIPPASIETRCDFVLSRLGHSTDNAQ